MTFEQAMEKIRKHFTEKRMPRKVRCNLLDKDITINPVESSMMDTFDKMSKGNTDMRAWRVIYQACIGDLKQYATQMVKEKLIREPHEIVKMFSEIDQIELWRIVIEISGVAEGDRLIEVKKLKN